MILTEIYYTVKHWLLQNKEIHPRCRKKGFLHRFFPDIEYYCTFCSLWKPHTKIEGERRKTIGSDIT